jgi:CheY-like chemotaxis protein
VGTLAGGIAHDFNNLLASILGNISLVRMQLADENKAGERLDTAEKACMAARDLTLQLLTFAKGGAPIKQPTSIKGLLVEAAQMAIHGANSRLQFTIADDLWIAEVDPGQINQVVNNLVINADQAMTEGGTIIVAAENIELQEEEIIGLSAGEYIRFSVKDEGPGISPEVEPRLFEPYFTTKEKGNGLGLASCYSIIRNHDGTITAQSQTGAGAQFTVWLPASRSMLLSRQGQQADELRLGQGKVLLMDDELFVRDMGTAVLKELGYHVQSCSDGQQALTLYREAMDAKKTFDLVILDLTIPGGMGGKQTAQKLLQLDPQARLIVSSGYSNDPVMANHRDFGFRSILSKPYLIEDMARVLNQVLAEA